MRTPTSSPAARRIMLLVVLACALVPLTLVGACMMLALGAGVLNYRDDVRNRTAADADPRLQRPLVSISGRILFIVQYRGVENFYTVNADGSGLQRVTNFPEGTYAGPAVLSPDRTRLVLNSEGLSIVRLDQGMQTTRLDRPQGALAWSPDGKQLASLSLDADKRLHLYVFNADGTGDARDVAARWPATAAGDLQSVSDLVWSPDGKRLAFVLHTRPGYKRSGPRHSHLYMTLADGSGLRNLSLEPGGLQTSGGLAWSPDGRRLAFQGGRGMATVDVDLKWTEIEIPVHGTRSSQRPAWSPDGGRLAWFNPDSIVVSDPEGRQQQELTRGRCRGVHPAWSDDGLRIAFVCHDAANDLFVMNADGSGLTQLTRFGENQSVLASDGGYHPKYPVWLPALASR